MEAILNFDLSVFDFVANHIWADWLNPIMQFITTLGDGWFFPLLAVILLIPKKTRKVGLAMLFALGIMLVINNYILKPLIARPRPYFFFDLAMIDKEMIPSEYNGLTEIHKNYEILVEKCKENLAAYPELAQKWLATYKFPYIEEIHRSFSFPSGHTSSSFAVAMAATLASKKWKVSVPAFILAVIIGFSRIYVHVHFCTDVLAGAAVGIIYGIIGYFVAKFVFCLIEKAISKRAAKKA